MANSAWLRSRLEPSAIQGLGNWVHGNDDQELGSSIFCWDGAAPVYVYERGLKFGSPNYPQKVLFDHITGVHLLNLVAMLKAQKAPSQLVELGVTTKNEQHVMRLPYVYYTTLSGILTDVLRKNGQAQKS